jgi:glyoxylase-like metal-dependent hydrolase (beta-lactamase superfamily II)
MAPYRLGNISVQRIIESEEPFYSLAELFPDAPQEAIETHRPSLEPWALCPKTGKVILPIQSFLIHTSRHTILIDTCVGNHKTAAWHPPWDKSRDQTWLANLAAAGVHPKEIDYVLCTHLHIDHCGWNTTFQGGRWVPTFPNARYVFARREYEHSQSENNATFQESVVPIMEAKQAILVDMDFALDDEIWLEPTPGHTPGHVAIRLASRGTRAVMCGDVMHSPIQCAYPEWAFVSDADPDLARKTRRLFLDSECESGDLVLTAHFPSPSMGHIVPWENAFRFRYI